MAGEPYVCVREWGGRGGESVSTFHVSILLTHHIFCLLEMFIPAPKFLTLRRRHICIVSAVHNGGNHTLKERD